MSVGEEELHRDGMVVTHGAIVVGVLGIERAWQSAALGEQDQPRAEAGSELPALLGCQTMRGAVSHFSKSVKPIANAECEHPAMRVRLLGGSDPRVSRVVEMARVGSEPRPPRPGVRWARSALPGSIRKGRDPAFVVVLGKGAPDGVEDLLVELDRDLIVGRA